MHKSTLRDILILLVLCYIAFFWRLGTVGLIDPDEPFYAQTAREMVQTNDWMTPHIFGEPQFEKPIFYYWLAAGSFKLFGENEFTGRLPSALSAMFLVLLAYGFGRRVFNRRTGFLTALLLATGVEYSLMSRLMLTDIPLAFFLSGAVFAYWMAVSEPLRRNRWMFLHVVCTALAVLTKGPIGSLIPIMATVGFTLYTKRPHQFRGKGFWWGALAYVVIVVPWYALMFAKYGKAFWDEFFVRDNWDRILYAEHAANNHWFYYIGILTVGFLPWIPLVIITAWRKWNDAMAWRFEKTAQGRSMQVSFRTATAPSDRGDLRNLLWIWIFTSLAFFSIAQSKLPTYIFFLFVPLALLMAYTLDEMLRNGFRSLVERRVFIGIAVVQCGVALIAPFVAKEAKLFAWPLWLLATVLAVSLIFLWKKSLRVWTALTSVATLTIIVSSLTLALPQIEEMSSSRPVAAKMLAMRRGNEPLMSGSFLVRGIYYYTHLPVDVISSNDHPFWSKEPLPLVIWKSHGIAEYLQAHGQTSALCVIRKSTWDSTLSRKHYTAFADRDAYTVFGENVIVRAIVPGSKAAAEAKKTRARNLEKR